MQRLMMGLILVSGALFAAEPAHVGQLRIQILSTMLADARGVGAWGLSAVVEIPGKPILFDTGAQPDTVLRNARELKVIWPTLTTRRLSPVQSLTEKRRWLSPASG